MSAQSRFLRAKIASGTRDGVDPETLSELRRDLRAERLADHIRQVVDAEPPLTAEQRDHLAALLHTGGAT